MTKQKYLRKLRRSLGNIPEREKDEIADYYSEIIDEKRDRGKSDREIFRELDSPEVAAANYLRERVGAEPNHTEKRSAWSAIMLPFRIILGFLAMILTIVVGSLVFAFGISGVVVALSSVYTLVMSIGLFIGGHVGTAFAQIGASFAMFGVAMLLLGLVPLLGRLLACLWRFICNKPQSLKPWRCGKKFAIGLGMAFAGALVFTAGFGGIGFDWRKLAVTDGIEQVEQEISMENLNATQSLKLNVSNNAVTVKPSDDGKLRVFYNTIPEFEMQFSCVENENETVLNIGTERLSDAFSRDWRLQWERGVFFQAVSAEYRKVVLFVPSDYQGAFTVETDNGVVVVSDMVCSNFSVTTENGLISVENITAQTINLKTENGLIDIDRITADSFSCTTYNGAIMADNLNAQSAVLSTHNGAVRFDCICANFVDLTTHNGEIKGSIVGKYEEYAVTANVDNGSCNLQNKADGEKILKARTSNGRIHITFED